MKFNTTLIALAIAVLPGLVLAQTTPPPPATPSDKAGARIDQRQSNQQQRIDAGVKSGELNQKEAARLQKGQDRVQRMEDKARADGKIDKKEARRIEHAQDNQSKAIYREKHDKQKAIK
jgi:polyhydroxyalkanoate synthesis regulator phasin